MSRYVPYPVLAALLMLLWLMLNRSLAPLDLLIGAVLGLTLSRLMLVLDPEPPTIRRPRAIVKLFFIVFYDVVRSNFAMIAIIFNLDRRVPSSGFVNIPLQLRSRYGLAALSTIITSTPGTFWAAHDRRTGVLTIHVLDLVDESYWARNVKLRYERLLMEIFE